MKRMGIEAIYKKPGTSEKHPDHQIYPYLLRNLDIQHANQVWALDTTYSPMARGFVYLTCNTWIGIIEKDRIPVWLKRHLMKLTP